MCSLGSEHCLTRCDRCLLLRSRELERFITASFQIAEGVTFLRSEGLEGGPGLMFCEKTRARTYQSDRNNSVSRRRIGKWRATGITRGTRTGILRKRTPATTLRKPKSAFTLHRSRHWETHPALTGDSTGGKPAHLFNGQVRSVSFSYLAV